MNKENGNIPWFIFVNERGDSYSGGKDPGKAIPGGGGEVIFNCEFGSGPVSAHKNFKERDLQSLGYVLLELNGEPIDEKGGLSHFLRKYDFGSELVLKASGGEKEDNILITPIRDETPAEAVLRESESETGITCEIVPNNGTVYNPFSGQWGVSQYGEVMHEFKTDKNSGQARIPGGRKQYHILYTFILKPVAIKIVNGNEHIEESAEVSQITKMALDETIHFMLTEDTAEYNPRGFYRSHTVRFFNTVINVLKIDITPYLPKHFNRHLPNEYFKFLPEDIRKGIDAGKFDFSEKENGVALSLDDDADRELPERLLRYADDIKAKAHLVPYLHNDEALVWSTTP